MKSKIILNIPHSSLKLPKEFKRKKKNLSIKEINYFNKKISDLYTDKLFSYKEFNHLKAKYSRIGCDAEKFVDDKMEIMTKYGLGVIYLNDLNSKKIFQEISDPYKAKMLNKYYYPYHKKLDEKVIKILKKNKLILIDCHSFSKEIIMDKNKKDNLPDICIGYDNQFCNQEIIDYTYNYFNNLGYLVKVNYPYAGSMVPNILFKCNNSNFSSIMLEINKEIYLNKNFKHLKKQILYFLKSLKKF